MSALSWFFFESLPALGAVLGLALFALLVYWRRGGSARPLLVGLGVAVVLLIVQAAVVTPRERAGRMLDAIAKDLEHARTDALAAALAPSFDAGRFAGDPLTRARFVDYVKELFARIQVNWTQRTALEVTSSASGRFVVEAAYLAEIQISEGRGTFRSRWQLTFANLPEGWRITAIEPVSIDGIPSATWDRIARE